MVDYGASIQLTDKMTPILNNIITSLNLTVSAVYDVQASVDGFDVSRFDDIRESIALAETDLASLNEQMKEPVAPPQIPSFTWSSGNFEVFTDTGIDRFISESQSALDMMNQLTAKQQEISSNASQTDVFSDTALSDMNNIGNRLSVYSHVCSR